MVDYDPRLKKKLTSRKDLSKEVMKIIHDKEWLRIWIPRRYKGLDYSLTDGLRLLNEIAKIDGSLGWFVTLISGANYFSRFIEPEVAKPIFENPLVSFGGSGMVGGTAEKKGNEYLINGIWHFATGAPHLTHFTLNAKITENGKPLKDRKGDPVIKSFYLEADQVSIIDSEGTMGMEATKTLSFEINDEIVPKNQAFSYDKPLGSEKLDKISFDVFADVTLLVNYLGIAEHFLELAKDINLHSKQKNLSDFLEDSSNEFYSMVDTLDQQLAEQNGVIEGLKEELHLFGENFIEKVSSKIIQVYINSGIKASDPDEEINRAFRDFFTITQHSNFRKR